MQSAWCWNRVTNGSCPQSGYYTNMLGRWIKQHQDDDVQTFRGNDKLTAEQKEISRLIAKNRRLKMEKDILKKVTVLFAKETK